MDNRGELTKLWRETSKEPNFVKWLDKQEEKCYSCEENCGNPWCPYTKEEE